MKNVLLAIILTLGAYTLNAQATIGTNVPKRETSDLMEQLWFGGGFTLGFSGSNNTSFFQLGVSPMVGYKIIEPFSIGPRVAVTYNHYRARVGNGSTDSANPFSYAIGAFARYKIIPSIFGHLEYELANEPLVQRGFDELEVLRRQRNNVYIGGGYTSSQGAGTTGFEMLLLYNVNQPENLVDQPFVIRVGFTYGF